MRYISALVTQGSGVMGNLVVEKNGVIRTRNVPSNPNSIAQQARRATMASLSQAWRDELTQLQRDGWNAYATTVNRTDALGKPLVLSGIDCYVGGNAAGALASLPRVDDAPIQTGGISLPGLVSAVLDDSANTLILTFATAVPDSLTANLFLSTGPVSPGRSVFSGPYRYHSSIGTTAITTITFTGVTVPTTGQKIGWRVACVDDNARTSKSISGLTTVVA